MKNRKKLLSLLLSLICFWSFLSSGVAVRAEGIISSVGSKSLEFESQGGTGSFTIRGTELDPSKFQAKVLLDGKETSDLDGRFEYKSVMDGAMISVLASYPANETENDRTYVISFSADGGNTFRDDLAKSVTVKAKAAGEDPDTPTPEPSSVVTKVTTDSTVLSSDAAQISFKVEGLNISAENLKFRVTKDGTEDNDILSTLVLEGSGLTVNGKIDIPSNNTASDITYRIYAENKDKEFTDNLSVSIVSQKKVIVSEDIFAVNPEEITLESKGGKAEIEFITKSSVDNSSITARVFDENGMLDFPVSVTGSGARRTVTVEIPENKDSADKIYTVRYNTKGSLSDFSENFKTLITVKAGAKSISEITSMNIINPYIPLEGGSTGVTVKGKNLTGAEIGIKVFRTEDGRETEVPEITQNVKFMGTDTLQSLKLAFPESESGKTENYVVKVGLDGKFDFSGNVEVSENGNLNDMIDLFPQFIVMDKENNTLIIKFQEPVFEGIKDGLKKGITIDSEGNGNFTSLSDTDSVEIAEDRVLIKSALLNNLNSLSRIRFADRTLKTEAGNHGRTFTYFIKNDKPVVIHSEIIEGETLSYEGGKAVMTLNGVNLLDPADSEKGTVVKVKRVDATGSDGEIEALVTGSGNQQKVEFNVPENTTLRSQTYLIRISLDGGLTYSSKTGINDFNQGAKLAVTVLPKEAEEGKPHLSHMTIQSYGTTVSEERTHTNVPVLQESKKTMVFVYGANLDPKVTKVRILDENGVYWTPVDEPNNDSMDKFIMVAFKEGLGIAGEGNTQVLEIICPRNIRGDRTYTYQIAVDGVHFDEETVVTATVLDDGVPGKHITDRELRNINVTLTDTEGKPIENPETPDGEKLSSTYIIKGYSWLNYSDVGVVAPILKGYTLVTKPVMDGIMARAALPVSPVSDDPDTRINDNTEFRFVYKADATEPENPEEPEDPEDPVTPPDPDKPVDPVTPDNPQEPEKPGVEEPEKPGVEEPEKPEVPGNDQNNPSDNDKKPESGKDDQKNTSDKNEKKLPNTGYEENIYVYSAGVLLMVIGASLLFKKKRNLR